MFQWNRTEALSAHSLVGVPPRNKGVCGQQRAEEDEEEGEEDADGEGTQDVHHHV